MKSTDFAPRTSALCAILNGYNLIGVEVGADVGAHAESLLTYCDIRLLTLIDPWLNPICEGYCAGRLSRWVHKVKMRKQLSREAVPAFDDESLDFVYLDQEHDYVSVREDLTIWWRKIKPGGLLALRNYAPSNTGIVEAVKQFLHGGKRHEIDKYHAEILIFKPVVE